LHRYERNRSTFSLFISYIINLLAIYMRFYEIGQKKFVSCPNAAIGVRLYSCMPRRTRTNAGESKVQTDTGVNRKQTDPLEGQTMMNFIKNFRNNEDGAVTVDWVVLTAAVVALAGAAYTSIETGASGLTGTTSTFITAQDPSL
jgi:Flp pilus assembly pilin Flp